jgi:hypothetical protein
MTGEFYVQKAVEAKSCLIVSLSPVSVLSVLREVM